MKVTRKVIYQTSFGRHWRVYAIGEKTGGENFFHFWLEEKQYGLMSFMFGTIVNDEEEFLRFAEQAPMYCSQHIKDIAILEEAHENE